MERSNNSLLNLQNTLPLFWYAASRNALAMHYMPTACTPWHAASATPECCDLLL
jgi:hypothetical protein